uniref:Adenylate kinase isoenzyme 6 homolog n=1 Tax=Alexandrium andersonii TaxID=327968 RepID=A0A7S2AHV4_9DINO|mmetsp:Transcript_12801/g.29036  ORF Transcript_12801/g.29036 Transcript_12801/m.29036 type:complete len:177 (+) Transcript_12801:118-648(+)
MPERQRPNVLVTGTPGVGKTTFCEALAQVAGSEMKHLEIGRLVRERKLYKEWDDDMECSIFDEDMVCDELEPILEDGGFIVDFHSAGFLPDDWFDLVVVLRADTNTLWNRLERRHYGQAKIQQNVEAEIFQTCLDEAREAFEESSVEIWEEQHDNTDQLDAAVARVSEFIQQYAPM